jgi:hypothetical protein
MPFEGKGVTREFIVIHLRVNLAAGVSPIGKKEVSSGLVNVYEKSDSLG